ncbi:MAG: 4'-phosphopantetheinyl transferase superfamily protein [Alphaproteobacteria bacterium]|nr:4'-phosphopantetheinyl transferase superfamily protein [Alphaproteobacteria bacterium]NNF24678.1 4'-phosphopantetheinyl transferase superfamily protein [Paracoccaceae bacterium]
MIAASALPGHLTVVSCRLDDDSDLPLSTALNVLDAEEVARRRRFVYPRDADRFTRSRGFLRLCLSEDLDMPAHRIPIAYGPAGKPYVPGADLEFNISHAGALAVLAISYTGPVGIDLEFAGRGARLEGDLAGLTRRCMTPAEQEAIFAETGAARSRRFLEFWTAKEARMKLTGEGMHLAPKSIELQLRAGRATGYLSPSAPPASLAYHAMKDHNAICCVAT